MGRAQVWQQIAGGLMLLLAPGCVTKKQQSPLVSPAIINHRQDRPRWTLARTFSFFTLNSFPSCCSV